MSTERLTVDPNIRRWRPRQDGCDSATHLHLRESWLSDRQFGDLNYKIGAQWFHVEPRFGVQNVPEEPKSS